MKTIRIDGEIGGYSNTVEEFQWRINDLSLDANDDLKVIINSPGGSVFEGFGIYNLLVSLPNKIIVEIEGLAASIATLIAFAAKKEDTYISQISLFMIHKASTFAGGNADDLEKQAEILKSIDETLISVYAARTDKTRKQIEDMLSVETWLTAENAAKEGFFTKANIINKIDARVAASAIQSQINKNMDYFKTLLAKYSNKGAAPVVEPAVAPVASVEPVVEPVVAPVVAPVASVEPVVAPVASVEPVVAPVASTETTPGTVTMEMFNELKALLIEVVSGLAEQKPVEDVVKAQIQASIKGLPTSHGNPVVSPTNLGQPVNNFVPQHKGFKDSMKDIEAKTRLS